jgi:hypothetical protein
MYARLLALVCLLYVSAPSALTEAMLPPGGTLAVFLRHAPGSSPAVLDFMKREAAELVRSTGMRLEWIENAQGIDVVGGELVVVDLRGGCFISVLELRSEKPEPESKHLGSTAVADGRVLPFSSVDCDTVRAFVASGLRHERPERREILFGRALGRVLAHELYHVVAQTGEHSHYGTGKAAVSSAELLADRFEFDSDSLHRLRQPAEEPIFGFVGESSGK